MMPADQFKCTVCGEETEIANIEGPTWCEKCCPGHDFEYDKASRERYCNLCGATPDDDWYDARDDYT